jgi:hypothetical protein
MKGGSMDEREQEIMELKQRLEKLEGKNKGLTSDDRGVYIPKNQRVPKDKANLHRSKAEFVEAQRSRCELNKQVEEYKRGLKSVAPTVVEEKPVEAQVAQEEPKRKPGRPKKIEA